MAGKACQQEHYTTGNITFTVKEIQGWVLQLILLSCFYSAEDPNQWNITIHIQIWSSFPSSPLWNSFTTHIEMCLQSDSKTSLVDDQGLPSESEISQSHSFAKHLHIWLCLMSISSSWNMILDIWASTSIPPFKLKTLDQFRPGCLNLEDEDTLVIFFCQFSRSARHALLPTTIQKTSWTLESFGISLIFFHLLIPSMSYSSSPPSYSYYLPFNTVQ